MWKRRYRVACESEVTSLVTEEEQQRSHSQSREDDIYHPQLPLLAHQITVIPIDKNLKVSLRARSNATRFERHAPSIGVRQNNVIYLYVPNEPCFFLVANPNLCNNNIYKSVMQQ